MSRNNQLKNKIVQLSYEHKKLNQQFLKIKKSANELNKLLDGMNPKEKKDK